MKRIYLSGENKKIAGILGGIGETYDIDPTLLRLIVVFLAVATGIIPMLIAYIVAWLIIPKKRGEHHGEGHITHSH